MKYWFGYPVLECECGFSTPDEDEFLRHLKKYKHSRKQSESGKKRTAGKLPAENKGVENDD